MILGKKCLVIKGKGKSTILILVCWFFHDSIQEEIPFSQPTLYLPEKVRKGKNNSRRVTNFEIRDQFENNSELV